MFKNKIKISNFRSDYISNNINKVFIIAEAGISHFGSLAKAKKLVDLAKNSGADAIKFQAYLTEELVSKKYKSWFVRYKKKETNFEFYKDINKYCKKKNIQLLLTPHSETAITWIQKLNLPLVKVGSGEIHNFDFIKKISKLKKPLIISTGMHEKKDLLNLKKFLIEEKIFNVCFLKCITLYPTPIELINIVSFTNFKKILSPAIVGYSDHSDNDLSILSSVALGAKIIEKHISLDFNVKNAQDWKVSHNLKKMSKLVKDIRILEKIMGSKDLKISNKEKNSKIWATRSIHAKENIKKGEKFNLQNICLLRPGNGINPKKFKSIIGKKSKKNYKIYDQI